jgi:hypothetical protein
MRRPERSPRLEVFLDLLLAGVFCYVLVLSPLPAGATFHQNEISKIMVGYNGDVTIQAVELKMLTAGQHMVGGTSIATYDADANPVQSLGLFGGPVPNGIAGRRILCATHNFATTFGITPDLEITPGLFVTTGQVAFVKESEISPCLINSIAYGAVNVRVTGTSNAPPLPADGATVLVRVIDDLGSPSCPLVENANANFQLASGSSGSPVPFTNNSGVTVNVFTTVAGVGDTPPRAEGLRAYPNPVRGTVTIESKGGSPLSYIAIYDLTGRLVRTWGTPGVRTSAGGLTQIRWDGTNADGRRVVSGMYFVQAGSATGRRLPIVLLR